MNRQSGEFFTFGSFRLDARERLLSCNGQPVPLASKTFEVLLLMVQNSGHLVTKDTLLKELWPDSFVEEANLTKHISLLRKALGQAANRQEYIETIPRYGYRFNAPVATGSHATGVADAAGRLVPAHVSPQTATESLDARGVGKRWTILVFGAGVAVLLVGVADRVEKRRPDVPTELTQRQLTTNSNENAVVERSDLT